MSVSVLFALNLMYSVAVEYDSMTLSFDTVL